MGLSQILEELTEADIAFILVGGLAAVVQGAPVTTMDVDVLIQARPDNIQNLHAVLESMDARYRRLDDQVLRPTLEQLAGKGHFLLTTCHGPLDVLTFIENNRTYEDLIDSTREIGFRGRSIRVLELETLVRLKRASNDPKDKQRLPVLEETLRQKKGR